MAEEYQVGDRVPEDGTYECSVCDESLGEKVKKELKKGEYFPKCDKCGDIEIWRKIS